MYTCDFWRKYSYFFTNYVSKNKFIVHFFCPSIITVIKYHKVFFYFRLIEIASRGIRSKVFKTDQDVGYTKRCLRTGDGTTTLGLDKTFLAFGFLIFGLGSSMFLLLCEIMNFRNKMIDSYNIRTHDGLEEFGTNHKNLGYQTMNK